jgi:hypothetical protein
MSMRMHIESANWNVANLLLVNTSGEDKKEIENVDLMGKEGGAPLPSGIPGLLMITNNLFNDKSKLQFINTNFAKKKFLLEIARLDFT